MADTKWASTKINGKPIIIRVWIFGQYYRDRYTLGIREHVRYSKDGRICDYSDT